MIKVNDELMDWVDGMTIKDLLALLEHTDFCAAVRLNGKLVSSPYFQTTLVPDDAVICLLPLIAGG